MKRLYPIVVALVISLHAILAVRTATRTFATCDEVGYLQSGLSHVQTRTFGMYRVNPPLPRVLGVLPVLAAHPRTDFRALETFGNYPAVRLEFRMQEAFLVANGPRFLDLLYIARMSNVLWSIGGALLVAAVARRHFGRTGALLSVACWCFEPNIIAHASVFTPDIPATVMALAATVAFAHHLERGTWKSAVLAGLVLGVAELTKFTLLVLYPIFAALVLLSRPKRPRWLQLGAIVGLSVLVIDAGYLFQRCFVRLDSIPFVSTSFSGLPIAGRGAGFDFYGNRFAGHAIGALRLPLPAEMLRGIDVQRRDFELGLRSYMEGEWRQGGFATYYLHGLAWKVPHGIALLLGLALLLRDRLRAWMVLPPLAILALVSSQTGFSHHLRYALPLFPFAFLIVGSLGLAVRRSVGAAAFSAFSMGWAVVSCLTVAPHFLSYFNELAGGPRAGARHLLDSNVDWGQDLLELRRYLARTQEKRPIHLAFFDQVPPESIAFPYAGVPPLPLECGGDSLLHPERYGPQPGLYAISVSYLRGSTFPLTDGRFVRMPVHETDFLYFADLEPVAFAGHSIAVFEITIDQANALRRKWSLPPLVDAEVSARKDRLGRRSSIHQEPSHSMGKETW